MVEYANVNANANATNASVWLQDADKSLSAVMRLAGTIYYLLLIVGGTAGNALAIVAIWTNRAMRKTRLVFIVLALSDTVVLLTNPPRYCLKFLSGADIREFDVTTCKLHTFLTYLSKDVATWVLVLISLERLIATWAPYRLSNYHASRMPALLWSSVMGALLAKNGSLLFVVTITTLPSNGGPPRRLCDCEKDSLTFRQAFMWLDSFVYCWLSSLCLFVFNGGIIYALHRSRKANIRKHQVEGRSPSRLDPDCRLLVQIPPNSRASTRTRLERRDSMVSRASREDGSTTTTTTRTRAPPLSPASRHDGPSLATSLLIPVSLFHLVTTLPIAVISVVEAALQIKHGSDQALTDLIQTVGSYMVMLMCLNNGLNCLVYFASSQRFRQHFLTLLKRSRRKFDSRVALPPSPKNNYFTPPTYLCTPASPTRKQRPDGEDTHLVATYARLPVSDSQFADGKTAAV